MLLRNIQSYGTQSIKYIYKTEQLRKQFFALTSAQMQMYLFSCLKTSKSKIQACLSSIAKISKSVLPVLHSLSKQLLSLLI